MTVRRASLGALLALLLGAGVGRADSPSDSELENLRSLPYAAAGPAASPTQRGVTINDRRRANPGYNLFMDGDHRAFLLNMKGQVVHSWDFSGHRRCQYARIFPNGDAIACCWEDGLVKVDKDSHLLWYYKARTNHEVDIRDDGVIATSTKIRGRIYRGRQVSVEVIDFLNPNGTLRDRWQTWKDGAPRFRELQRPSELDVPASTPTAGGFEYFHMNSIQFLPSNALEKTDARFRKNNLLVSFRNTSLMVVLDQYTQEPLWSYGPGETDYQHMPQMMQNGDILIFDNRFHGKGSRVIELAPETKKIVWEYPGDRTTNFSSKIRGNAERLPNGDTLICEADKGHVFEVTPKGDTVWEFWNPFFATPSRRFFIYRMLRLTHFNPARFSHGPPVPLDSFPPPVWDRPN